MAANIIIIAAVGTILFFAVRKLVKDRKKGGCAGCSACSGGSCGGNEKQCSHHHTG